MRSPIPFDTHAFVKRLTAAGVPERQAEVQAEALAEIGLAQLATKDDLAKIRDDLANMEQRLRSDFKAEIAGVNAEIAGMKAGVNAEIAGMKAGVNAEIAGVKAEMKTEIRELELRIAERLRQQMFWFFAAQVALFSAPVALVKLL